MIAFIIVAYNNPKHLDRLVTTLKPNFYVYLNIHSYNMEQFSDECKNKQVPNPMPTRWGEWCTTKAVLNLLSIAAKEDVSHIVYLSGNDFPIVTNEEMLWFFDKYKDTNFMSYKNLPWPEGEKFQNRIPKDFNIIFPNMTPYCGYTYWAITKEAAQYVLETHKEKNEPYLQSHVPIPDEFYIQTLLANTKFKFEPHLTYYNFNKGKHGPETLTIDEFTKAIMSCTHTDAYGSHACLFARKFDDYSVFLDK